MVSGLAANDAKKGDQLAANFPLLNLPISQEL
jgi:hypothetical protein